MTEKQRNKRKTITPKYGEVGTIHESNSFGKFKIISYDGFYSITVEFIDTGYKTTVDGSAIKNGKVKDKLKPSVYGVGYVGDGEELAYKNGKDTIAYSKWSKMLQRCYSSDYHETHPTYIGCSVCDEWHNFQNFASWFEINYFDGAHLDKDIKIKGNKEYGPEACSFVTMQENTEAAWAKNYKFTDPNGVIVGVYNLKKFCEENNLSRQHMSSVHSGKRKSHKGWSNTQK